jgi:hypothetical protein
MTARCSTCLTVHDPDDSERCRNARKLQMVLSAAGAIPRACDANLHLRYKADGDAFLLNTNGWKFHDDGEQVLLYANCRRCGSTLAYAVRNSDSKLAAAVELLKVMPVFCPEVK